ncbi:retrovirus-related pol polyprotein from transposon TNT 1-94 [Tanacetum coccineum]
MDDMIKEKIALKEQVDSLEQKISKQIKEKECLLQTFTVFKSESKEKEDKYMENKIDLEKKIKELDNILFKVGQSAQTVHMLTKPQAFYDNIHKQALGYQNPFHLKKAQRIKPTLYDGIVISDKHVAMPVIDDEETLILEEESRSKIKPSDALPVKIEAPKKLPKISLSSVVKQCLEITKKELLLENDRLLQQIMSQDVLLTVMNSMSLIGDTVNMDGNRKESCNLEAELLKSQNAFNDLLKSHSQLEKHCISLECSIQLNQEIFQKREFCDNQNALEILEFFENNDLKAQLQDKSKEENVNYDYCEIETKNVELENSVAKLLSENERLCNEINHVKQVFKEQFDSIKKTRVRSKEQSDSLIDKLNLKSAENEDLKAQIQDKEQADILRGIVEQAKAKQPLDKELDFACKHAQRIQELLVYVQDTCPNAIKLSAKKVVVTPKNNVKKVRFAEPLTSSSNIKQVESSKTSDSNTPVLSSTGLKCSTSKCGSKPTGNKRNDRISQTPSRNMKNKVEAQPRKVNKKNHVVEPICDDNVKHSKLNANSDLNCATCKKSLFDDVHDKCLLDFVKNVNSRAKSAKKHKKQNIWKPTGHPFTEVGFKWKPTGRTFTIAGNSCPLTRITSANVVPLKQTAFHSVETQKPELKVYNKKPKNVKNIGSSKKAKIVESKTANHSEPNPTWGSNATDIPSSSSLVMTLGNVTILRVYYVEGLGHNLFSVGQFCDGDLEVAFQKNTCFIRNLEGVDLLFGSLEQRCQRRNQTLVEAAYTMLIFSEALLFLWAEAIDTACYIQNRSLIRLQYNKTPYELMQDKKLDLSFFHVFGALCYPTNDNDDLGKLDAKADIDDWDRLFKPMFDEYFTPPSIVVSPVQEVAAPRAMVLADSPLSTCIDQDALSISIPSTQEQENSPNISQGFEESPKTPTFCDDPFHESFHEDSTSQGSSSNVRQTHTPFEHLGRWTKDHPIANVIDNPSRPISIRKQLKTDVMWCYFDAFLTSVEPKNFKQAMTEPSWIDAMQEEIHEFQRLEV